LTDLYKIWFGDAKWLSQPLRPLKKLNFKNPIWRTAAILKIVKSPYLCDHLMDFDEILHYVYSSAASDVKFDFLIVDNLIRRRAPMLRIEKLFKYIL